VDVARSAEFYARVFGWSVRRRPDGSTAFDDGVGEVSGTWVPATREIARAPSPGPPGEVGAESQSSPRSGIIAV